MTQVSTTVFPQHEHLIFWTGVCLAAFAIIGLVGLFAYPAKRPRAVVDRPSSTTLKARGGGIIELEDIHSSADTLLDVEEVGKLSLKGGRHRPPDGGTR